MKKECLDLLQEEADEKSKDDIIESKGPLLESAIKDGALTKAGEGFLKANNIEIKNIKDIDEKESFDKPYLKELNGKKYNYVIVGAGLFGAVFAQQAKEKGMILDKVHFNSKYNNVEKIAMGHHEFLDGSGYPYGLKAEQLMLESRILAVADIYDALTSTDRPYKKPISQEKAFKIIEDMAEKGKLEIRLVRYLKEAVYEAE